VYSVQVLLSGARAVEVNADLVVSGTAQSGLDFEPLPTKVRFFPGQTTLSFPHRCSRIELKIREDQLQPTWPQ